MSLERFRKDLNSFPEEMQETYGELRRREKYDECLALCNEALKEMPDNIAAVFYRGVIFSELKQYAEAITDFERVLSIAPDFYHVWRYKGRCELYGRKFEDAVESYTQCVKLNPYVSEHWNFVALAYFMCGRDNLALRLLDLALEKVPDKNSILLIRGILEEHTGNRDATLMSYLQSQILSPDEEKPLSAENIFNLFQ